MSVLFLHTVPRPKIKGTDAVFQETALLKKMTSGIEDTLFPLATPNSLFPRNLYGWTALNRLRKIQKKINYNHIFSPTLYHYPILNFLRQPIIYTVVASLSGQPAPKKIEKICSYYKIIVSNERDARQLDEWGINNYQLIRTGMDFTKFHYSTPPNNDSLTLLQASAPWEKSQFKTKGIELLLEAAQRLSWLKIVFLWRGNLYNEMLDLVKKYRVQEQIEIINKKVDVNQLLTKIDATVLLTQNAALVKSFPHSLLESLVSGRPVLLSDTIPMADYIRKNQLGEVIRFDLNEMLPILHTWKSNHIQLRQAVSDSVRYDFSQTQMLSQLRKLYRNFTNQ